MYFCDVLECFEPALPLASTGSARYPDDRKKTWRHRVAPKRPCYDSKATFPLSTEPDRRALALSKVRSRLEAHHEAFRSEIGCNQKRCTQEAHGLPDEHVAGETPPRLGVAAEEQLRLWRQLLALPGGAAAVGWFAGEHPGRRA